jgi:hypothetical protein
MTERAPSYGLQIGQPMPTSIGLCADEYHALRQLRLAMEKETAAVKAREDEVEDYIINNLSKSDDTGAAGKFYRAQIKVDTAPKLAEGAGWQALTAHVARTGEFDLLQKRLNNTAVKDRWDAGADVPGVERMRVVKVSITKI